MSWSRRLLGTTVLVMAAGGLTACDPTPPPSLTVTTATAGADANPGDGICEVTSGAGDCSLPAAVEEGNALGRAALTVPAGVYEDVNLTVTGNLDLNYGAPADVRLDGVTLTVAAGGKLRADGLRPGAWDANATTFTEVLVAGRLELRQSQLRAFTNDDLFGTALRVLPGGWALVTESIVAGGLHAVENEGTFGAQRSSLINFFSGRLVTSGAGQSYLTGSLLARGVSTLAITTSCEGTPPTSLGYNYAQFVSGCNLDQPGDQSDFGGITFAGNDTYAVPSNLIDAIPIGEAGCKTTGVDAIGNPRGVDGNGDGVPGCDIGALEHQP